MLIVAAAERERALTIVSVAIYGAGLLGMIGASALYNLAAPSRRKELLRRLDHAAIFLMIAGTYTPFTLVRMGGDWGLGIAIFVWLAAVAGIALKLLYPRRLEGLSILLYLAIGWAILVGSGRSSPPCRCRPSSCSASADCFTASEWSSTSGTGCPITTPSGTDSSWARRRANGSPSSMASCGPPDRARQGQLDSRILLRRMTSWMKRSFSMTGGTRTNG